jgi:hypothetical protein
MTTAPSPASPSLALRLARLLRPGRNPVARGVDRTEATAVILLVLLALVLVPVMLTLGSLTYANFAEHSEQQARTWHKTVAVLTEDTSETSVGTRGEVVNATSKVTARWQLPDGTTRTGLVDADDGLMAGAEVTVWLDESGNPVNPPMSTVESVGAGMLVAFFGWLIAVGLIALAGWGLHHVLDRRRYRAWDIQWARVEPDWHDRSR